MLLASIRQLYWTPWYFTEAINEYQYVKTWLGDHAYLLIFALLGMMFGCGLIMEVFFKQKYGHRWPLVVFTIGFVPFVLYILVGLLVVYN